MRIFHGKLGGITGLSWSVKLFDKDSTDILKKENLTTFFNSSLFGGLVLIPVISSYLFKTISY